MNSSADILYQRLPAIHRVRDAQQGYPLRELLEVIAEQVSAMQENLDQLYDDQFIETCAEWVAPYIGDLIGYRSLHGVVPGVASPRADVANTIAYRRRKGTASMLEQVARDVTGWPARAVEFFQLLGWTQYMNHRRGRAHYAPDLRNWQDLEWLEGPFDKVGHTVEVRNIASGSGRYNIPNVGLYLWRVRAFPLTRSPAVADAEVGGGLLLRCNPLGADMPLYNTPATEESISHLAEPVNVPIPLDRRWLKAHLGDYYGPGKSLFLELEGAGPLDPPQPVPAADIRICNLSDIRDGGGTVIGWAHQPAPGSGLVAIDPVLGRIALGDAPATPLLASFHYGFTLAMGGGEYERGTKPVSTPVQKVSAGAPLQPALDLVRSGGTVEVSDSYIYRESPAIAVDPGASVTLLAANGHRPLLEASGAIALNLGAASTLILDGWLISGGLAMPDFGDDEPRRLILRDCTLVPGSADVSLELAHPFATIEMERCISGPIHLAADAEIEMRQCIVDAAAPHAVAWRAPGNTAADELRAGGSVSMESCTVIGKVHTRQLTLASDCLFVAALAAVGDSWDAPLWVERRQQGCVRFSFVPPGARTPRRFHCQPVAGDKRTRPHFTSLRYGDAGYCQLREATPDSIRRGAHDESEMGVMHDLYQPQRETNLKVRLDEYLRFGLEAGIFYAS